MALPRRRSEPLARHRSDARGGPMRLVDPVPQDASIDTRRCGPSAGFGLAESLIGAPRECRTRLHRNHPNRRSESTPSNGTPGVSMPPCLTQRWLTCEGSRAGTETRPDSRLRVRAPGPKRYSQNLAPARSNHRLASRRFPEAADPKSESAPAPDLPKGESARRTSRPLR